jgi:hypothetical protein
MLIHVRLFQVESDVSDLAWAVTLAVEKLTHPPKNEYFSITFFQKLTQIETFFLTFSVI